MKIRRIVSAAAAAAFLLQIPALADGNVRAVVDYERSRVQFPVRRKTAKAL